MIILTGVAPLVERRENRSIRSPGGGAAPDWPSEMNAIGCPKLGWKKGMGKNFNGWLNRLGARQEGGVFDIGVGAW